MNVWIPSNQPPPLILESQIPPTMNKLFKKFLASYLFAYLMLGVQVLIVMLLFIEHLTPTEFILCAIGLWIVCSIVIAYVKDM